jgi:hypothetical protein
MRKHLVCSFVVVLVGCGPPQVSEPKPPRHLIHVCDWHYVPKESFIADLRTDNPKYSAEEIDRLYAQHLVDVEAVQAEQIQHLRILLHKHHLRRVWVEGLTPEDMSAFQELVRQVKAVKDQEVPKLRDQFEEAERLMAEIEAAGKKVSERYEQVLAIREQVRELLKEHREQLLRIGAAGRMLMAGELAEIVPLDDDAAHKAANPLKNDGTVVLDESEIDSREKAMAERLLAGDEAVVVIVLGAAHDLTEEFEGTGAEYRRIVPSRVEWLVKE